MDNLEIMPTCKPEHNNKLPTLEDSAFKLDKKTMNSSANDFLRLFSNSERSHSDTCSEPERANFKIRSDLADIIIELVPESITIPISSFKAIAQMIGQQADSMLQQTDLLSINRRALTIAAAVCQLYVETLSSLDPDIKEQGRRNSVLNFVTLFSGSAKVIGEQQTDDLSRIKYQGRSDYLDIIQTLISKDCSLPPKTIPIIKDAICEDVDSFIAAKLAPASANEQARKLAHEIAVIASV